MASHEPATNHPSTSLVWEGGVGPAHGELWAHDDAAGLTLAVRGSMCTVTAGGMGTVLTDLVRETTGDVAIDLSGVTYFDPRGARVLLGVRNACSRRGHELTLVRPSGPVRRLLDMLGQSRLLGIDRSLRPRIEVVTGDGDGLRNST